LQPGSPEVQACPFKETSQRQDQRLPSCFQNYFKSKCLLSSTDVTKEFIHETIQLFSLNPCDSPVRWIVFPFFLIKKASLREIKNLRLRI
jgi:hypothetical protein